MGVSLSGMDKVVGQEMHLKDIDLEMAPGSLNVILGRTLAGKTSLLRIIAGLDRPSRGRVVVDGKDVTGVSVRKRSVAMVYQQFVNYPSLTVYHNIASPLKVGGVDPEEIDRRVREAAAMLRIEPFLDRLPAALSGGQQQRTAIARALVKEARVLLLDEPLVNLDYKLREELRIELQEIFADRRSTVVYTTTEPSEALMLGGSIVVLDEGRILQTGETPAVYRNPASIRVAEVFSDPPVNFITAVIEKGAGKRPSARLVGDIALPLPAHLADLSDGAYLFGVRPHHLFLAPRTDRDIRIEATVELCEINGSETFIHARHRDITLVVQEERIYQARIGSHIAVYAQPDRFYVYDDAGRLVAAPPAAE